MYPDLDSYAVKITEYMNNWQLVLITIANCSANFNRAMRGGRYTTTAAGRGKEKINMYMWQSQVEIILFIFQLHYHVQSAIAQIFGVSA